MIKEKKSRFITVFIFILSFFVTGSHFVYTQDIPTPTCVCAECSKKCGTGHEKWCKYNNPKSIDGVKDMNEKSMSDFASLENFSVYTDNGFYVKVTNRNSFDVKYSFEYDLTGSDKVLVTYTCTNYVVSANTVASNLFTATDKASVTRILVTSAEKNE